MGPPPTVLLLVATLAQSPADRASLEVLRDSLAAVSDSLALHQLEAKTIPVARQHRDDPMIHLRLGFIGSSRCCRATGMVLASS